MKKNYGVNDIAKWTFDEPTIPEEWAAHPGELPVPFRMYVEGEGGHGKTEYVMMLSKMTATHIGKTFYNNVEQGKHKSIKQSHNRNEFKGNVRAGKWMYNSINNYDSLFKQLEKRNSGKVIIIDSISFFPLGAKQIQALFEAFPRKSFVLIAYAADSTKNRPIKHLCDIKVEVRDFKAYPRSRFEGNKPFTISEKMHLEMMRQKGGKTHVPGLFDLNKENSNSHSIDV